MKVVLIGSGNVATHLGIALKEAGHQILQVWSKTLLHGKVLADILHSSATDDLTKIDQEGEIYIIAVKDDFISEVAAGLNLKHQILVHTSGTVSLDQLAAHADRCGVFYPLQTFSKNKSIGFLTVPVLVEGNTQEVGEVLFTLAGTISNQACEMSSEERSVLHVAAVFACNFSNHLYALSEKILQDRGIDFNLLKPLIAETAAKIQHYPPADVQTGPAIRNDLLTLARHKELLNNYPDLKDIYEILSNSIMRSK
ncbi:hypothetical protein ADIARSV_3038 [Arcticibacter svalbardensis MN12-7]|uniref:DUF2520 domain-containing protein n=1 Tax=Arcticibacter svalbardensis MN12-7 TaxID=1150600 RepID=R9GQI4_9SPHI|nr:DUF2520 domain-containing protein [Arcticibacter svalbardensis]EOR93795.1 hypothetical protein ADIARSV_3038 [Arcticibacter svalbardensis MN12-7]